MNTYKCSRCGLLKCLIKNVECVRCQDIKLKEKQKLENKLNPSPKIVNNKNNIENNSPLYCLHTILESIFSCELDDDVRYNVSIQKYNKAYFLNKNIGPVSVRMNDIYYNSRTCYLKQEYNLISLQQYNKDSLMYKNIRKQTPPTYYHQLARDDLILDKQKEKFKNFVPKTNIEKLRQMAWLNMTSNADIDLRDVYTLLNLFFAKENFYEMLTGVFIPAFGNETLFKIVDIYTEENNNNILIKVKRGKKKLFDKIEQEYKELQQKLLSTKPLSYSLLLQQLYEIEFKSDTKSKSDWHCCPTYYQWFINTLSKHIDCDKLMYNHFFTIFKHINNTESKNSNKQQTYIQDLSQWGLLAMWSCKWDKDFICDITLECNTTDKVNYFMLAADNMILDQVYCITELNYVQAAKFGDGHAARQLGLSEFIDFDINNIRNYPIVLVD